VPVHMRTHRVRSTHIVVAADIPHIVVAADIPHIVVAADIAWRGQR
jgi:hypothetical protein